MSRVQRAAVVARSVLHNRKDSPAPAHATRTVVVDPNLVTEPRSEGRVMWGIEQEMLRWFKVEVSGCTSWTAPPRAS